jgi:1-acyl-sn-glycerol-3-phosphate acyltransferase
MQTQHLSQRIGYLLAAAAGWRVQIQPPPPRCVIIGAPHTSGWDLPLTLLMMLCGNLRLRWVGKHTLFRGPLGWLMRALGGIPVDRRSRLAGLCRPDGGSVPGQSGIDDRDPARGHARARFTLEDGLLLHRAAGECADCDGLRRLSA